MKKKMMFVVASSVMALGVSSAASAGYYSYVPYCETIWMGPFWSTRCW